LASICSWSINYSTSRVKLALPPARKVCDTTRRAAAWRRRQVLRPRIKMKFGLRVEIQGLHVESGAGIQRSKAEPA